MIYFTVISISPLSLADIFESPLALSVTSVSRSLMIRVIMKWSWGLCTDLLVFTLKLRKTLARRPSDGGAVQPVIVSNEGPLPPNQVGRIAQYLRKGEGRN